MGIYVSLTNYNVILNYLDNDHGKSYCGWLKVIYHESGGTKDKQALRKMSNEKTHWLVEKKEEGYISNDLRFKEIVHRILISTTKLFTVLSYLQ